MDLNILFWNVQKKDIGFYLDEFAKELNIDCIVLAEFDRNVSDLSNLLAGEFIEYSQIACKKIAIFYRKNIFSIETVAEASRYTIKKLTAGTNIEFLMVAVHLQSKVNVNDDTQRFETIEIKREIEMVEDRLSLDKTFILGDFNMNPFEDGMVSASSFNSIPCQKTAMKISRTVQSRKFKYFYNPMWNLFGDYDNNPGTYFALTPNHTNYYWNILDQVILRPSLLKYFVKESLVILQKVNGNSLLDKQGRPYISDHLPFTFKFDFNQ